MNEKSAEMTQLCYLEFNGGMARVGSLPFESDPTENETRIESVTGMDRSCIAAALRRSRRSGGRQCSPAPLEAMDVVGCCRFGIDCCDYRHRPGDPIHGTGHEKGTAKHRGRPSLTRVAALSGYGNASSSRSKHSGH